MHKFEELVKKSLDDFKWAAFYLKQAKHPSLPKIREKRFFIINGIYLSLDMVIIDKYIDKSYPYIDQYLHYSICRLCGYQPRKVLRAISRIEIATLWCKKRLENLTKFSQNIPHRK